MISRSALFALSASLIILSGSTACNRDPYKVNLSGIECDITVRDLGREIFETPPHELAEKAETLSVNMIIVFNNFIIKLLLTSLNLILLQFFLASQCNPSLPAWNKASEFGL